MKGAGRQVYFQDVKLQMDAKLWGEEYNKHKPPKKVLVGGGENGKWREESRREEGRCVKGTTS